MAAKPSSHSMRNTIGSSRSSQQPSMMSCGDVQGDTKANLRAHRCAGTTIDQTCMKHETLKSHSHEGGLPCSRVRAHAARHGGMFESVMYPSLPLNHGARDPVWTELLSLVCMPSLNLATCSVQVRAETIRVDLSAWQTREQLD